MTQHHIEVHASPLSTNVSTSTNVCCTFIHHHYNYNRKQKHSSIPNKKANQSLNRLKIETNKTALILQTKLSLKIPMSRNSVLRSQFTTMNYSEKKRYSEISTIIDEFRIRLLECKNDSEKQLSITSAVFVHYLNLYS